MHRSKFDRHKAMKDIVAYRDKRGAKEPIIGGNISL
jgi:hypothetical protein